MSKENIKGFIICLASIFISIIISNIDKEVKTMDLAQESLMIKLTYEKDLEKIREMLGEYDIVI